MADAIPRPQFDKYRCYYCPEQSQTLTEIVTHCRIKHICSILKFRELVLNETSGKYGYRTKLFPDIIPENLSKQNKHVTVENDMVVVKNKNNVIDAIKTPVKLNHIDESEKIPIQPDRLKYLCIYCKTSENTLAGIVNHCVYNHVEQVLKYRELELDPLSDKYGYRSKLHEGTIPSIVKRSGKQIIVENNIVTIKNEHTKLLTVNTPVKTPKTDEENERHTACDESEPDISQVSTDDALHEMENLLPKVLNTLFEKGKLGSYLKFNRLISEGKLPMNNICFLLFMDLVEWFSCRNTVNMRYQNETQKFWQIGYRLFHGKFIRFMSGLRNYGQVLDKEAERSELDPAESRINFAVPAQKNLYRNQDKLPSIYPGVCETHIQELSEKFSNIPLKVCVDGKKICRGKGKVMGDIDCWGYESKPSLQEKKSAHNDQVSNVQRIQSKLDSYTEKGTHTLQELTAVDKKKLVDEIKDEIKCLAECNKLLRAKHVSLEQLENKFRKLGGKEWMTSRYYPVICSVRVNITNITSQLDESIKLSNKLAYFAATLNNKQELFNIENVLVMEQQSNYMPLNETYVTENSRYIPQRTDKWMEIRQRALVTGSTCNNALGLSKLKDQQAHFDQVVNQKPRPEIPNDVKEKMEYGVEHEIDAIATVCGKVLPAFYPNLCMFEEGCIRLGFENFDSFMVVSPDGSLRETINGNVKLAYENKCKAPMSYSKTAYYTIPLYYIPQLLCEMKACNCEQLLFTCWAEETMTVFEVNNDKSLWDKCWVELTTVYGEESRSRPKHFTERSKELKKEVKVYRDEQTALIGEFQSVKTLKGTASRSKDIDASEPYLHPHTTKKKESRIDIAIVQDTMTSLKKWYDDCYDHLRAVASEILVFMVTDFNRVFDMESNNAHVIGYAMKGPSMKNETLRLMMRNIITACEDHGLNISVTSSDGQWHQYGVRDDDNKPLTVHQLQRDLWTRMKSVEKGKLQATIRKLCQVQTLDDIRLERSSSSLTVLGHRRDKVIRFDSEPVTTTTSDTTSEIEPETSDTFAFEGCIAGEFEEMLGPETLEAVDRVTCTENNTDNEVYDQCFVPVEPLYCFNNTLLLDLDKQPFTEYNESEASCGYMYEQYVREENTASCQNSVEMSMEDICETRTLFGRASQLLYESNWSMNETETEMAFEHFTNTTSEYQDTNVAMFDVNVSQISMNEDENSKTGMDMINDNVMSSFTDANEKRKQGIEMIQPKTSVMKLLNSEMFSKMLHDLQHDEKCLEIHKWLEISLDMIIQYCQTKESMNKHLQKREVYLCAKCIERECRDVDLHVLSSWPKYRLLDELYSESKMPTTQNPRKKKRKLTSLKDLCWDQLKYLSKDQLAVILAQHKWEDEYLSWKANSPVPFGIQIINVCEDMQWFTCPRVENGIVRFHFTDACHLLTCLRTKLCTTGINGLQTKAWEIAALSKDTKLNITVVVDCVDKQDVVLARRVFGEDVECVIAQNGYDQEAKFCRLIRHWYDAEDEPAIPAVERCRRRFDLLKWLLEGYNIGTFPPPTRYVKGIPIITYEAMVAHLERKLQLYAFTPNSSYNVRATGTQEVEQLFSSFRDMDPSGTGTVRPDIIPGMLASAMEVDNYQLNPDKSFYLRTSGAEVYPSQSSLPSDLSVEQKTTFIRSTHESHLISCINPRDHLFDHSSRDSRKHKRPSGLISLPNNPAHGERGVRQYHRRDDSKIHAHRRLGFIDLPDA